jgi:hypothetical protein
METRGRPANRTSLTNTVRTARPTGVRQRPRRSARRNRWRGPAIVAAKTLAVVLPLLGMAIGLAYLRLLQGPVSVSFLLAPVERGLKSELPGVAIDIEDAIVRLAEHGGIEFRLKNVRIDDSDGETLALAPLAAVHLSTRAMLSGRIAPASIELIDPRILISQDEQGHFALSFAHPDEQPAAKGAASDPPSGQPSRSGSSVPESAVRRFALARVLAESSARARRQEDATSFLETIGLRNAEVIFDAAGHRAKWQVLELGLNLQHKQKRSIIKGSGKVASANGPWSFSFRTEDSQKSQTVRLDASVQDLVPHTLAPGLPQLSVLHGLDLPLSATGSVELSTQGEVLRGNFALELEPGRFFSPWLEGGPIDVGSGRVDVRYSGEEQRFDLEPSKFSWGKSNVVVVGTIMPGAAVAGRPIPWEFDLKSLDGVVATDDLDAPPLKVNRWLAKGRVLLEAGSVRVDAFHLDAGGAQVSMAGDVANVGGRVEAWLDGQIGQMPVASLKALWPNALAPRARAWASLNLLKGTLKSGSFRVATSRAAAPRPARTSQPDERRRSLTLEGADLEIGHIRGLPPIEIPRALLRVEGDSAEITVPEGSITAGQGRGIALKSGRFVVNRIDSERPLAELQLKGQSSLAAALDIAELEPIALSKELGVSLAGADGKVDGQLRVTAPVGDSVTAADIKIDAKIRISDGRAQNLFGSHDIHGATIAIDATEKSVDVRGDMLVGGVSMKLSAQRLIGALDARQPSIKISAKLDNSDRNQLGLDVNHMVQGEVPVDIVLQRAKPDQPLAHVIADLTGAELMLDDIAWRKPPGRAATLQFDVFPSRKHDTELQNFKLIGDNVAIDGWVGLGPDHRAREFYFPGFSLNIVTNIEVHGVLRPGRVWEVKAHGKTYDANELFRSLIAFGRFAESPPPLDRPGLDLSAEIDTVLGASDTAMRSVKLRMQKRAEQLTMLDLRGILDGGKPLTARLKQERNQPRLVIADSPDAGQALKLIGFYSNMVGGTGELELNLDGRGSADRFGVLAIRNFRVLGDPVVTEVLQNADEARPAGETGKQNRRVVREQFGFDRLHAPFSLGNGQLVIENAHVKGDLVGATMRGKIDYRARRLQLGGTYVPLSGFNSSFAPIPILGPLLTGPRGEGVLGITFAIQGPMAQPQVIVNPLSFVLPGILREIFQMTPENPRITPRDDRNPSKGGKAAPQVRASPPASVEGTQQRGEAEVLGGWSSETTPPATKTK